MQTNKQSGHLTPQPKSGQMDIVSPVANNQPTQSTQGFNNMSTIQKEVTFNYKKKKDEQTGMESKRAPEVLKINFPTVQDLVTAAVAGLNSDDEAVKKTAENSLSLIQDAVEGIIIGQARSVLEDKTAENFPYNEIDWEYIANLPPAQRKGGGIPKEQWEAFTADYSAVMPAITGKDQEKIDNAATLLGRRLATVKNSKEHLKFFEEQLNLYTAQAPNAAEYVDVLEFLNSKIEEYLSLDSAALLAKL